MIKKIALITGASSGLGFELGKKLIEMNFYVISLSRTPPPFLFHKCNFLWIKTDLQDPNSISTSCMSINEKIDLLVHCAGVYSGKQKFEDESVDSILKTLNTNLIAPIILTKCILSRLKECSSILVVNSVAGLHELEGEAVYSTSKFGLKVFFNILGQELYRKKISITQIFPGGMKTKMQQNNSNYELFLDPKEVAEISLNVLFSKAHIPQIELYSKNEIF